MKTKKALLTGLMFLLLFSAVPGTVMAAGKKAVYVLTSVTQKGEYIQGKETKLSYNKNGLLSNATIPSSSLGWPDMKLKASYNSKGNLKEVITDDYTRIFTQTFSYKSGKLSKHTTVIKSATNSNDKSTRTVTYKWKGRTFTATTKDLDSGDTESTATGKLNAQNRLQSVTTKYPEGSLVENTKYQYDAKGFLKSISHDAEKTVFKNTVKSGRLKKRTDNHSRTYTFKYAKIKVPSSYVKKVKAQQNYILDNLTEGWYSFYYPSW